MDRWKGEWGATTMKLLEEQDAAFAASWDMLLREHANPTALISQSYFDYRTLYLGRTLEKQVRAVVVEGARPVIGSYFELVQDGFRGRVLDATAASSAVIIGRDATPPLRSGAETLMRKWLGGVAQDCKASRVIFLDQAIGGGLSALTHWALEQGATIDAQFNQIIDLTADHETLWRGLTKSCQWGVNWGRKNMVVSVRHDAGAVRELRRLHLDAVGFATRSAATWELQAKMVENDEAFVVVAEMNGAAVSAALFQLGRSDCYYGVSASDRLLFAKPLSHVILWEAIKYASQRGCLRFALGSQVWERFRWHLPAATRKEANISKFKRSFGGTSRAEFVVTLPQLLNDPTASIASPSGEVILREVMPQALADPALARGERVFLRPLVPQDITDRYLSWFPDPDVHRFLEVRSVSHAEAKAYMEEGPLTNSYYICAICDLETGLHVGNLKIGPIRWEHGMADMVTVIGDKRFWGRHFGTEAIRLACGLAFGPLGLRKLHASMYADNIGSLRAYTRAGWNVEARLRNHGMVDGKTQDIILISYFNSGKG
jgi:RimJ/RimL family protein N-acetyltransferase